MTYLLDISRLISRVGRGPISGIDRVELAYFEHFLTLDAPCFFIARIARGYALLNSTAAKAILLKIKSLTPWGSRDFIGIASRGLTRAQQQAQSELRRCASVWMVERQLATKLRGFFPGAFTYINVGHSNLRAPMFAALKSQAQSKIIVLIHDIIPLTYPEFSRSEVSDRFAKAMQLVSEQADLVIYNSADTQRAAEVLFSENGRVPKGLVAHIGLDASFKKPSEHVELTHKNPYFVCLGTIEPRKNHALLLKIWQDFATRLAPDQIPHLHIIGRRGWNNAHVFDILDHDTMINAQVFEHSSLNDGQVKYMLQNSHGLLFPSFVEGFGLPLIEAASMGLPIICGENAIYREILGDYPLYLNVDNFYLWSQRILERAGRKRESEAVRQVQGGVVTIPLWSAHFDQIFRFI